MNFWYYAETTKLFWPKPNLHQMSYINIRPKTKLAETVQIFVFGTETKFQSVLVLAFSFPKSRVLQCSAASGNSRYYCILASSMLA